MISRSASDPCLCLQLECCDEPAEDCSGGYPHTCNAGCAALLLPFWQDCRAALGKGGDLFQTAVQLCGEANGGGASLADQMSVQCTDGTAAADCIPECTAARRGVSSQAIFRSSGCL